MRILYLIVRIAQQKSLNKCIRILESSSDDLLGIISSHEFLKQKNG